MEYEVGQEVIAIETDFEPDHKVGDVLKVKEIDGSGYHCEKEGGETYFYYESELKPNDIEPAGSKYKGEAKPLFKKGDTVRVVGDSYKKFEQKSPHKIEVNAKAIVTFASNHIDNVWRKHYYKIDVPSEYYLLEQDLELVEDEDKIEIKEDVMGELRELTRAEKADENDKRVEELEEQIAMLTADSTNLRKYKTDRDETIAQIMSKYDCKKDKAEDILALHEKGIK